MMEMSETPESITAELRCPPEDEIREKFDSDVMRLNVPRITVLRNIRDNLRRQLPQLGRFNQNPQRVAIVAGGWSLRDTMDELLDLYHQGVELVAVNGSAQWLMERNLKPALHVVLDSRPENIEFVRKPIPGCKYFFASQVDGSLIEHCADRDVTMFHAVGEGSSLEERRLNTFYSAHHPLTEGERPNWVRVPPCGTVGLTSVLLLLLLGFNHQHIFGLDSCIDPASTDAKIIHHAYPQALNDSDGYVEAEICGRRFICSMWQAAQIESFKKMMALNGEFLDLTIHGDGILAHICATGAAMVDAEKKESARGSAGI